MVKSLLSLFSGIVWLVKFFIGRRANPQAEYQRSKNENAQIIATGDQSSINRKLDELTDRLPTDSNGDSK